MEALELMVKEELGDILSKCESTGFIYLFPEV
jgi:hypothetical protein